MRTHINFLCVLFCAVLFQGRAISLTVVPLTEGSIDPPPLTCDVPFSNSHEPDSEAQDQGS
jgi:hypothetical protein